MAEYTKITDLLNKQENQDQKEYIEGNEIPSNEVLTAKEFVEKIVQPIIELQDGVNELSSTAVKAIKQGETVLRPDENGIVNIPGADTTVAMYLNLSSDKIVSITGKIEVEVRAISTQGGIDTGEVVDVQVMYAAEGSTDWSLGGSFSINTKPYDSEAWDKIDVTEYVGIGVRNVQFVVTGRRTGATGYSRTFLSVVTSMYLVCQQNYQTPIDASMYSTFPIAYSVYGIVAKTLHIKIKGSVTEEELTYELSSSDDSVTIRKNIVDDATHGYLTHGVRQVEAWLTADDGQGGILESKHLMNRFMVVNTNTEGIDIRKPYLLIQNESSVATNFVQQSICDYAVYSPKVSDDGELLGYDGDSVGVTFLVTAYAKDYLEEKPEEYFRMEQRVVSGTQNTLNVTIEIEPKEGEEEHTHFNAYFRAYKTDSDGNMTDMLYDSIGAESIYVNVDNTDSFAPMSGADFVLNPKVRNNTESHPMRILNARKNNIEIPSKWENFGLVNDGWITNQDDNQKVLRVTAGTKLAIAYNPFSQFLTVPDSSMTMEFDIAIRNMTDETEQVIGINEEVDGRLLGLVIRPITGVLFSASNVVEDESDFRWQEDKRVHVVVNIHNSITPDLGDAYKPTSDTGIDTNVSKIALIRVFINGTIEREMKYSISNKNEFLTEDVHVDAAGEIRNGIVIGSSSADIDIYSIRVYKNMQLDSEDIQNDWISSLPTSEEKLEARKQNAIKSAGKIDIEKVKALGKRCLVWHGKEPYYYAADAQRGYWEIFQYNEDGTLNRELSGTIAKETKRLKCKRQGSTANTYYYSNLQTKVKDLEDENFILVNIDNLHSSIVVGEPYENESGVKVVDIYGGNLGKNYPVENKPKSYKYIENGPNKFVEVPDGWVDGNGKYRGLGYIVTDGTPMAQKLVNKINYASPMQSHLCGCTRAFSDLHKEVVGRNSVQEVVDTARVAKYTEPFYFFVKGDTDAIPVFRGLCTFGGGKADKPTWGYVKKKHPMMMMVEGSDNNYTMTDFRCPWDSKVTYDPDGEGWVRGGLQHWDFDMGATDVFNEGSSEEYEIPKQPLINLWKEAYNFNYIHSPMIKYYAGTFTAFKESKEAENTTYRYWCTEGSDAFCLKRYDDVLLQWVDAGFETETDGVYEVMDLTKHEFTAYAYAASQNKNDFDKLNTELISAIVAHWKKYLAWYFKPASVRFHYCFINHLMAGTDNCSKNTYYVSDPKPVDITIDGVTKTCYQFEMHQDDVDTIGPTDNNGRSTKPYYIDRMHPFSDTDSKTSLYEGNNSSFFNLCELAFENTLELQSTMRRIFDAMSDIMSSNTDKLIDFDGSATNTVWGFFHKYFFNIQRYFSPTAFNETARIRYEYPAMINYTSRGPGARGIAPITQSVGPQMQSEIQFYRRRLVLMASYASWGDFYDGGKTHKLGISEAADSFPLQAFHLPDSATSNTEYKFTVRPHQYIYPTGVMGQTPVDPHVRLKPDQEYVMSLGTTTSNDTGMSLLGINYYKSIGNIGDLSVSPNITVTINGKRLTEFIANPTKEYVDMETGEKVPAFRPGSIKITASRISKLSLNGCKQIGGTLDVNGLTRVETIDVRNTNISNVKFPQSTSIRSIYLGKIRSIELYDMPKLETFVLSDYSVLTSFIIGNNVPVLDTYSVISGAYNSNAQLKTVKLNNINWTSCESSVLMWLTDISSVNITGNINVHETSTISPAITFDMKTKIIDKFGNVDDLESEYSKGLKLTYASRRFIDGSINGNFYNDGNKTYNFSVKPNNIYYNSHTKIEWYVTESTKGGLWEIDKNTGVLTVHSISQLIDTAVITVKIISIYGGEYETILLTKSIEIYDRQAKLGDYVFADGTYSSEEDDTKTPIGICFWTAPRDNDGQLISKFAKENDKQTRLCVSLENVKASSTYGNTFTSFQWGCYSSTTDEENGLFYPYSDGETTTNKLLEIPEAGLTTTTLYDIQGVKNITSLGSSTYNPISNNEFRDESSEDGIANGGFKPYSIDKALGDGFAYNETEQEAVVRKIDSTLLPLVSDYYRDIYNKEKESVDNPTVLLNIGYVKTLRIIEHRNKILNNGISLIGLESVDIPNEGAGFTELESLANLIDSVRLWAKDKYGSNYNKWSQILYPAASAAYAYEPIKLKSGEQLSSKFKKHNWFAPTLGQLALMCYYYSLGTTNDANIFKRAISKGIFTNFSDSLYLSSSEYTPKSEWAFAFYNGNIYTYFGKSYHMELRAVAAF